MANYEHPYADLAGRWIAYQLWAPARGTKRDPSRDELRADDAEAERHGFDAFEAVNRLVREQPESAWVLIQRLVELSPNDRALASVAAGPLEDLLCLQPYGH
jgi:hypothetical protein